jgi:UDP-N-acetylmuramoyl-L-alanyl-D-glutamate--2,6-diaminopimelate ligase
MMVRLDSIIGGLEARELIGDMKVSISDITSDSRKVAKAGLFACFKGTRFDGHVFASDAVRLGAAAILAEHRVSTDVPVTQVIVDDVRAALALISSRFYGLPSQDLTVVGITGTNGKTTTVHFLRSIIDAWGRPAGILGTLGHWIGDSLWKDPFTTPESPELQRYMRLMVDRGMKFCVMEVSSHAIALRRVDHVSFDVVGFTNLSRDHLDFHDDFDEYRKTKMKLFGLSDEGHYFGKDRRAAVNVGDATGRQIADRSPLDCLTYCLGTGADVTGQVQDLGWKGATIKVTHGRSTRTLRTSLGGEMNAQNALAAYAVAIVLGIDADTIAAGIADLESVPGRMEMISGPGRQAIVDYAHTPDALKRLLADARQMCSGRLICVFGCGGDRDPGKRPEMGRIAGEMADVTIVTSDNPRTEDPLKIIEDIVRELPKGTSHHVIPDRKEAITQAVAMSLEQDIIVIAGKGHEDYQIIGNSRRDFDDREVVRKAFGVIADAKA